VSHAIVVTYFEDLVDVSYVFTNEEPGKFRADVINALDIAVAFVGLQVRGRTRDEALDNLQKRMIQLVVCYIEEARRDSTTQLIVKNLHDEQEEAK